jgi:trehalose/maltose hydrolase-like predicted phosphorylase
MPLMAGMAIVSGVVGVHPERRIEAAAASPYPLGVDIGVDGVWLYDQPWAVSDLVQSYDFGIGELASAFTFQAGDTRLSVEVVLFASRTAATLVLQEVAITADRPCELSVRATTDTTGLRGHIRRRRTDTPGEPEPVCDGSLLWEPDGGLSACGVALHTELVGAPQQERQVAVWDEAGPMMTTYRTRLGARRPVRLRQIAGMVPSLIHARPDEEAVRRVARGRREGFDALRAANRAEWAELWKGRIVVHGASAAHQALIDAAFYYLMSSVHAASPSATSIFGQHTPLRRR